MGSYAKLGISCKDVCKVWYQGFGPLGKLYGHPTSKSDVSKAPKEGSKGLAQTLLMCVSLWASKEVPGKARCLSA